MRQYLKWMPYTGKRVDKTLTSVCIISLCKKKGNKLLFLFMCHETLFIISIYLSMHGCSCDNPQLSDGEIVLNLKNMVGAKVYKGWYKG